ncbi:MAG: hypothetical protein ACYCYK_01825 [Candidatus Dormibacteria bacterium]
MSVPPRIAPYHSTQQYAPLRLYRASDLSVFQWAEEQFQLEVSMDEAAEPSFRRRAEAAIALMDQLPLQVKDLLRGLINRMRLQPSACFDVDELGCWLEGEMRLNCDPAHVAELQGWPAEGAQIRRLLQTTVVHECGHALAEDPKGGVPLRNFMHLLVVSGWLPHPLADPVPFLSARTDPQDVTEHLLSRLRGIDPRWNPELPAGDSQQPRLGRLDWDLMGAGGAPIGVVGAQGRPSLGLRGPRRLGQELMDAAAQGTLDSDLAKWRLSGAVVRQVASRYRPVSSYAEDLISETPAEIFRQLHRGPTPWTAGQTAMREGDRILVQPWRLAELEHGRGEPAPGLRTRPRPVSLRR